ncbi:uncharacterized protein [Halyomorpha halys]|uniref:uncharacterized protein n=1 Tax=Halyomorpha halys TaxID=286706 RepID=UPI0006D522EE|nr:uncharacterized protein LOC106685946 [Halyomorpha halys]
MARFVLLPLLFFLIQENAVIGAEINVLNEMKEHENSLNEVKEWFLETMDTLREEIQHGVEKVRDLQTSLKAEGEDEIRNRYDINWDQLNLMSIPPECVSEGDKQLQTMLNTNVQGFLQCPNLTLAAEDVVGIGFEAAKLTAQLLITADEVMNGFGSCWSWNPLKFIWCSFGWIKESVVQSFRSIKDIQKFMSNVNKLVKDIIAQYKYCTENSKRLADLHTVQVLNQVHKCTLKGDRIF